MNDINLHRIKQLRTTVRILTTENGKKFAVRDIIAVNEKGEEFAIKLFADNKKDLQILTERN